MTPALRFAAVAAVAVLAGCSTPAQPEQKVATLQSPSAASAVSPVSSANPVATEAARPRERLDMTPDESQQLFETYNACLADHGFQKGPKVDESRLPAAENACLSKKPLPPWEYDTTNPEAVDFVHKLVLCLRAKGVRYVDEIPVTPGDDRVTFSMGGRDNDSASISKGMNLTPVCEKELSAGGGK
jgi:hypothetical protein